MARRQEARRRTRMTRSRGSQAVKGAEQGAHASEGGLRERGEIALARREGGAGAIGRFRRVARADWRDCLPRNRVISIDISLQVAADGFFVRRRPVLSARLSTAARALAAFFSFYPPFSSRTHRRRMERPRNRRVPPFETVYFARDAARSRNGAASALLYPVLPARGQPPVRIKNLYPGGKSDSFLTAVVHRPVELSGDSSSRGPLVPQPRTVAAVLQSRARARSERK